MQRIIYLSFCISLFILSCENKPTIEGLWIITSVTAGEEEMTPNARWTRFNSDQSQESGNGRFQHSYGTWKLNPGTNELSIVNTNGLKDSGDPFVVSIDENEMTWERNEGGQNLKVSLERATKLPETYGDKILGLWKLEEAKTDGDIFMESKDQENNDFLFFKWDGKFEIGRAEGKVYGVYNVHGHKPEVELIPYGDQLGRSFWTIDYEENSISLKLLNTDETVIRKFVRINEFPR